MLQRVCLLLILLATFSVAAAAKERTWTSADGRTMRAEFVRELDGEVTFLIAGKLTTIPLSRLSERDQQIVRDLAAGKEVPDDPAPATPAADDPFSTPAASSTSERAAASEPTTPASSDADSGEAPPSLTKRPITPTNRVWTDNVGRKTTAKFVRVFNGHVVLSRAGGPISVPFYDLVEADQQYVKDLLTSRGEEDLIPARPLPGVEPSADEEADGGARPPLRGPAGGPLGGSSPMPPGGYGPPTVPGDPGAVGGYGPPAGSSPGGYSPGGSSPGGYGPGGYGPGGIGPDSSGPRAAADAASMMAEQERRATDAMNAAQRQTNSAFQAQEDHMNQMMQSSSPSYSPSTPTYERVPVCSACKATLHESETHGKRCPRCGAWWTYDEYHQGGSSSLASTGSSSGSGVQLELFDSPESKRALFGGIAIVVVVAVVVAIVLGVIFVAMAIASTSRSRQYKEG